MKDFFQYPFGDHQILQTPNLWQTYHNYNYMIAHRGEAFVFDPGEFEPIERTLKANGLLLKGIYLTHHHRDHVGAVEELRQKYQCPVFGFIDDQKRLPKLDHLFSAGSELEIAGLKAKIMFLPGHTLGLIAYYFAEKNWLFSNDLLFSLGCGRIFEGTPEQMFDSLNQVYQLPDDTIIFSSHEYTANNLKFALREFPEDAPLKTLRPAILDKRAKDEPTVPTTLAFEKTHNPFLRWNDKGIRQALNMNSNEDWEVFAEIRRRKDQA